MSQNNVEVGSTPSKKVQVKRYSPEFIQKTVCDYYRSGMSIVAFCSKVSIPCSTFRDWRDSFAAGHDTIIKSYMSKDDRTKALESENAQLKQELAKMKAELDKEKFRAHAWETMVDVAEEMFNIPIRKKVGTKQ